MSKITQKPPTLEIVQACRWVDEAILRFISARDDIPSWGKYEAQDEAHLLLIYSVRFIESITSLAQQDLVLLPAALTLARTVADASIKVLWMLNSEDLFECESRWLTLASDEHDYFGRTADLFEKMDPAHAIKMRERGNDIKLFHNTVKQALENTFPGQYKPLKKLPSIRAMLKELNSEPDYWKYVLGSQFTHASPIATGLYRRNHGTQKRFGEFVEPENWRTCFEIIWLYFEQASRIFLERYGGRTESFCTSAQSETIQLAFSAIK